MIKIDKKESGKKIRVNITVDKELLDRAKTKLEMFGGKVSTLFNAYLNDFVESIDKNNPNKELAKRIEELEERLKKLEKR
jgi:antitoxin component of RelBE/YafQ-DinJ toxin-antitoxin module